MTSGVDKGTSQRLLKTFNNTNQQIFYFVSSLKKNLTSICFENIFDFYLMIFSPDINENY